MHGTDEEFNAPFSPVKEWIVRATLESTFLRCMGELTNRFVDAGASLSIARVLIIQSMAVETWQPLPALSSLQQLLCDSASEPSPMADGLYVYKPFPSPEHWFRILVLWPAQKRDDPINKCSLAFELLSSKAKYEALSYAWGDETNKRTIYIEDRPFQVTSNLFGALKECRYSGRRPRVLWVDAVCINQRDIAEKNVQVQNMATVYQRASRVLVWLGPISNTSAMFWEVLDLYRTKRNLWQAEHPDHDQSQFFMPLHLPAQARLAVHKFLSRSWFGRAWVIQEVVLAKSAIIRCGHREIDWETFSYFVCDFRHAYVADTCDSEYPGPRRSLE